MYLLSLSSKQTLPCRNGTAKLLLTVATSLEELVIEYCHPMLTTITFRAMSKLSNLTVGHDFTNEQSCRRAMSTLVVACADDITL